MNIDRLARVVRVRYLHSPLTSPVIPVQAEPWMDGALCTQAPADMWFPEGKGASGLSAVRICRACTVRTECLAYALENREDYGIWAGTTPNQRKRMRRAGAA